MEEAEFVGVTRYIAFNDKVTDDANLNCCTECKKNNASCNESICGYRGNYDDKDDNNRICTVCYPIWKQENLAI